MSYGYFFSNDAEYEFIFSVADYITSPVLMIYEAENLSLVKFNNEDNEPF